MRKYKKHVKVANMLLQALYALKMERFRQIQRRFEDFNFKCSESKKDSRQFNAAVDRDWQMSASKIALRVKRNLSDLSLHLDQFKSLVASDDISLPKPGDLIADMLQVEQEYGQINFDLKANTISVITEPIVLDEMSFGPFEIQLLLNQIKKLATDSPYKLIALNPNPAGSDCDVTHPHVSHEKLCEGDGFIPIRKAIQQGRLCDFFTIIVQILQTYNPGSPYVSLEDWEGVSCYDCGYTIAGDDCYYCEDCQRDYCSSCSTYCQICDRTICLGCSFECPSCNQPVCRDCNAVCADCDETLCQDCINEEGLCNNCQEQRKEQEDEELEEEATTISEPKIQSDSLGQTRISA
jgi:hypothetical protein